MIVLRPFRLDKFGTALCLTLWPFVLELQGETSKILPCAGNILLFKGPKMGLQEGIQEGSLAGGLTVIFSSI